MVSPRSSLAILCACHLPSVWRCLTSVQQRCLVLNSTASVILYFDLPTHGRIVQRSFLSHFALIYWEGITCELKNLRFSPSLSRHRAVVLSMLSMDIVRIDGKYRLKGRLGFGSYSKHASSSLLSDSILLR